MEASSGPHNPLPSLPKTEKKHAALLLPPSRRGRRLAKGPVTWPVFLPRHSAPTVRSNGSSGHRAQRRGPAPGAPRRSCPPRGAAARCPRGPRPGLEQRHGGAGRARLQRPRSRGSPGSPTPGGAAARAPRDPAPRPDRGRSAAYPRTPAPRSSSHTTRAGRTGTYTGLRPAPGLGRDRARPAARTGPQGPEAAVRGRLRPSVQPGT